MNEPLIYSLADALSQARLDRVDQIMQQIRTSMERPGARLLTSTELKQREDRRHQMATSLKMRRKRRSGVKQEYR